MSKDARVSGKGGEDVKAGVRGYFGLPPLEPASDTYERLATEIGRMTDEKRLLYGDSVERAEKIMTVLYPDGVPVSALRNALLIVRIADKLSRIATDAKGDNEDAWRDIAGYGLIGSRRNQEPR